MNDRRPLVTFHISEPLHRELLIAAAKKNRSIGEEVETRLMALRCIQEALQIVEMPERAKQIEGISTT